VRKTKYYLFFRPFPRDTNPAPFYSTFSLVDSEEKLREKRAEGAKPEELRGVFNFREKGVGRLRNIRNEAEASEAVSELEKTLGK
jgi:hypothetical protein